MSSLAQSALPNTMRRRALYALIGAIFIFVIALPAPDLIAGVIPYLIEGHYTFAFRTMQALTVAAMFIFIIVTRTLLVWGYAHWAKRRDLFRARMDLTRVDVGWCIVAAIAAIAINMIQSHFSGEPHQFTWVAFIRYWGMLPGIGNTILQYIYYVTEGFAVIWIVDAFQNAGEYAIPRLRFPWGALGLMATWGIAHYLSKDLQTAIYVTLTACIIGLLYFANRKDVWPPLILWLVMTV
jgi:hypothetical protein